MKKQAENIILAGEYALQLLSDDERAAFEKRFTKDAALERLISDWNDDFAQFAAGLEPVNPPRHIKIQIKANLEEPTPEVAPPPPPPKSKLSLLRFTLGALLAIILALAVLLAFPPYEEPEPTETHVAVITSDDGKYAVHASFDQNSGILLLTTEPSDAEPTMPAELWLIAEGATAPILLGALTNSDTNEIVVSENIRSWLSGGILAINESSTSADGNSSRAGKTLAAGAVTAR